MFSQCNAVPRVCKSCCRSPQMERIGFPLKSAYMCMFKVIQNIFKRSAVTQWTDAWRHTYLLCSQPLHFCPYNTVSRDTLDVFPSVITSPFPRPHTIIPRHRLNLDISTFGCSTGFARGNAKRVRASCDIKSYESYSERVYVRCAGENDTHHVGLVF